MAALDRPTVEEKLGKLREVVAKLEQLRQVPEQEFRHDAKTHDAAMYDLVIGIEAVVDIGNHLLTEAFQRKAPSYASVIEMLEEEGVIPRKFADEQRPMVGFRNILIHEYADVDLGLVYENLQRAPGAFRSFATYYLAFIDRVDKR